jgi:selenium-binding protein 1
MPTRNLCKKRGVHLLVLSLNIFLSIRAVPALASEDGEDASKYLICAGDQARSVPDFLFLCPSTTLDAVHGNIDFRGSIRVWDFKNKQIVRTVKLLGSVGTIDVKLIRHDRMARAYTAGMLDDRLYLVDTLHGTAKAVFDFATIQTGGWPQLMRVTRDGGRLFVSMNQAGKIAMFDISTPDRPHLVKALDRGQGSGPHYIALTNDEKRLVVSDYFLNADNFGTVHAEGDHNIHVAKVTRNDLVLDPRFKVDFNTAFSTGPARPHGIAIK